jgi:hypothetical protein
MRDDMTTQLFTILRNTISGVATEYTPEEAAHILKHPVFGKVNKVVRVAKPEVLSETTEVAPVEDAPVEESDEDTDKKESTDK